MSATQKETSTDISLEEIPRFQVVLINDDYTPMEFVEAVLQNVFAMSSARAQEVTMEIHNAGRGVCGVYSMEVAEAKVHKVTAIANHYEHPLLCEMEPAT